MIGYWLPCVLNLILKKWFIIKDLLAVGVHKRFRWFIHWHKKFSRSCRCHLPRFRFYLRHRALILVERPQHQTPVLILSMPQHLLLILYLEIVRVRLLSLSGLTIYEFFWFECRPHILLFW
jgi:hypothetical protein